MTRVPLVLLGLLLSLPAARADIVGVTSNDDSGPGTLRQAILDANSGACAAPCEIAFVGPHRIEVLSELPAVTASAVTIRAATQSTPERPDATVSGSRLGSGIGLTISAASNVSIRGLTFEHFDTGLVVRNAEKIELLAVGAFANRGDGVVIERTTNVRISTAAIGMRVIEYTGREPRPNGGHGIRLHDVTGAALALNVIRNNGGHGILISGDSSENILEYNELGGNGGLAVDVGGDGPNPNTVIESARANRGFVRVTGSVTGRANTRYDISIASAAVDPSGFGEGVAQIGGGPSPVLTDANGRGRFTIDFTVTKDTHVTAIATRYISEYWPWGETSEFSNTVAIVDAPPSFDVTSAADAGPGTLRAVLEAANDGECSASFPCHVSFSINETIRPLSALPPIRRAGLVIDGGAGVEIDGSLCADCNGLEITSADRTIDSAIVRGLTIRNFPRHGIVVMGHPRARFVYGATIENCFVTGNGGSGVSVQDAHVATRLNVISGNGGDGITVNATTTYGANITAGDRIGTDPSGLFPMPNGGNGIAGNGSIFSGSLIAFNVGHGIHASGAVTAGYSIHSNGGRGIVREVPISTPVIESARFENGKTVVRYSLDAPVSTIPYRHSISAYTSSFTDASGRGEAKRFLKSVLIDNAAQSYEIEIDENLTGKFITLTRTTFDGFSLSYFETSEFSRSVQVIAPNCGGEATTLEDPAGSTFRWSAVPGAITHRLWMMKPGGAPAVMFDGLETSATLELEPGTYEWWVETRFDCWGPQTEHRVLVVGSR